MTQLIQITRLDLPAETALTAEEIDMLMRRGAARVVVERDPAAGGGVTAIGVLMRRGEPPYNTLLFRIASPNAPRTNGDGATILRLVTLEQASDIRRAELMAKIGASVQRQHDALPPNDGEPEEPGR